MPGKPDEGKLQVRFDEAGAGNVAFGLTRQRSTLLRGGEGSNPLAYRLTFGRRLRVRGYTATN